MRWVVFMTVILFSIAGALTPVPSTAQEMDEVDPTILEHPQWLILEYGKRAMEEGEFGVALRYIREALSKEPILPEAEMLIGDIFFEEGNLALAEQQYKKALDQSHQLYILDQRYTILEKLAGLYRVMPDSDDEYRETLTRIVLEDADFNAALESPLGDRYLQILSEEGFDYLITLYRLDSHAELIAHHNLGILYHAEGDYRLSTLHFLFTVLTVFSKSIEELQFHDPDYIYEDAREFFRRSERFELITDYFSDTMLYLNLYYLADSLVRLMPERGRESSLDIFRLVENLADTDQVRRLAGGRMAELGL
jgi:tetratricopeptide (TPR) repeat protein